MTQSQAMNEMMRSGVSYLTAASLLMSSITRGATMLGASGRELVYSPQDHEFAIVDTV